MRIAIDIDSTLHHYWEQLERVAAERFGVSLSYERQLSWGIEALDPEQLRACVHETHDPARVLAAQPYPGAVEAVVRWHRAGHFIHITSHRSLEAHEVTARWLERIGLPFDELYCSYDKIARCREIGIDLLIDDSPVNLAAARDAGILTATIRHPWNGALCDRDGVLWGWDWPELDARLAPLLDSSDGSRASRRRSTGASA